MIKTLTLTVPLALLLAISACNTVEGFGEDVQQGGQVISDKADDVEEDISN